MCRGAAHKVSECTRGLGIAQQHQLLVNRLMRSFLAGTAGRKTGITDPDYIAPEMLDYN